MVGGGRREDGWGVVVGGWGELGGVDGGELVGVGQDRLTRRARAVGVGVGAGGGAVWSGDLDDLSGGAGPDGAGGGADRGPAVVLELVGAAAAAHQVPGRGRPRRVRRVVVAVAPVGAGTGLGRAVAGPVPQGGERTQRRGRVVRGLGAPGGVGQHRLTGDHVDQRLPHPLRGRRWSHVAVGEVEQLPAAAVGAGPPQLGVEQQQPAARRVQPAVAVQPGRFVAQPQRRLHRQHDHRLHRPAHPTVPRRSLHPGQAQPSRRPDRVRLGAVSLGVARLSPARLPRHEHAPHRRSASRVGVRAGGRVGRWVRRARGGAGRQVEAQAGQVARVTGRAQRPGAGVQGGVPAGQRHRRTGDHHTRLTVRRRRQGARPGRRSPPPRAPPRHPGRA